MNYVEKNLRKDEEIVTKAKISFLFLIPKILWFALILVAVIVLNVTAFSNNTSNKPDDLRESVSLSASYDYDDDNSTDSSADKKTGMNDVFGYLRLASWILMALVGGLPLIFRIIVILTTHLVITNKRVIGKQGVLKIQTLDIPIDKIDNVSFNAGVFGNLFKYYDVTIKSVGSDGWAFHGISNAQAFKDCANDAIEQHAAQARKDQAEQIAMAMHSKPNA